jgi:hypothetical protein
VVEPTWSVPASPGIPVFTFPRPSTGRGHQPQLLQFEHLVLGLGEFLQMRHLHVLVPLQAVGPVFVEGELGWIVIVWCSQYSTQPGSARVGSIRPDRNLFFDMAVECAQMHNDGQLLGHTRFSSVLFRASAGASMS